MPSSWSIAYADHVCRSCMRCGCVGRDAASARWAARRPSCGRDRDREADADEKGLVGRVGQARDDADDLTGLVEQGAARVAGVDGGVDLDEVLELAVAL